MASQAERTGPSSRAGRAQRARQAKTPPRPVGDIISDLTKERDGLVEAVDNLKVEARATKDRLLPRALAIVGAALASLFLLRRRRRKRR